MKLLRSSLGDGNTCSRDLLATLVAPTPTPAPLSGLPGLFIQIVFWFWNVLFFSFALGGLGLMLGPVFVSDFLDGRIPFSFVATLALAIVIPMLSVFLGVRSRRDPRRLLAILYGFELPAMGIAWMRLFIANELTSAQTLYYGAGLLGMAAFALSLYWRLRPASLRATRLFFISALAVVSLHLALFLGVLYFPPLGLKFLEGLVSVASHIASDPLNLEFLLLGWLGLMLFAMTSALLAFLPAVTPWLYATAWQNALGDTHQTMGRWAFAIAAAGIGLGLVPLAMAASARPLELEEVAPADANERRVRLDNAADFRAQLLDAYLARHRYQGEREQAARDLAYLWQSAFGGEAEYPNLRALHDALGALWLYPGDMREDARRARAVYAEFFDADIERGEHDAIARARSATFDRDQAAASLADIDARTVRVAERKHTTSIHGAWAELELYERYVNVTDEQQEVVYSFSLPEGAAVTGLWLGETSDKASAFRFEIAPRGAARRVYEREVQRRVDPALLEQTGPLQYRLRAFPIPARWSDREEPPSMHLWLQIRVLGDANCFPVPTLLEKRNAFWSEGEWWPPAEGAPTARQAHRVALDARHAIEAEPADASATGAPRHLLVAVDRSYSMRTERAALARAIAALGDHRVDWVLTSGPSRGEAARRAQDVDPANLVFFGGQSPSHLLAQTLEFANESYDAVVLLTDTGSFELESPNTTLPTPSAPVYFVHLGGTLPIAYATAVKDAIQKSGGFAVRDTEALLARLAVDSAAETVVAGYRWRVVDAQDGEWQQPMQSTSAISLTSRPGFDTLAAARAIELLSRQEAVNLDTMHGIAKRFEVVSNYSSMIVLVNQRQQEALAEESTGARRFDMDDDVMEVSGVPEPEHWMLLLIAAAVLYATHRRRRTLIA
ncbi:MAG: TIGR02921 family PEP-CTERM protein [Myxococcota bacterium]